MSEFQYFEFRKIDGYLSKEEMTEIRRLSSRAKVVRQGAIFTYSFGDFRGSPQTLLANHFDAFLYISNFGTKELSFCLPSRLLQTEVLSPYSYKSIVKIETHGNHAIITLTFNTDEGGGWIEEEDCLDTLDDMLSLREELLLGDPRALYLTLIANQNHWGIESYVDFLVVPSNLNTLSPSLQALTTFLEINPVLLEEAQCRSPDSAEKPFDLACLSESEKDIFLRRILDNDSLIYPS
jgi:hypothetical protein